ncbi:MAG: hypothetical protein PHZ00_04745 [Candidatus Peribacteraceae bacterium]|nr:hypothetical protein [Candidatus Peribacteraceae bacterium]
MQFLSTVLIAASIFDFLPAAIVPAQEQPRSAVSEAGTGELTVQLEDATPVGAVPRGATNIPVGILNISASCDADITIRSIDLTHVGMGRSSDISAVYVNLNNRRLSRAQRFDRTSGAASVAFRSLVVKRCDAIRLAVNVTVANDADPAGEHGVILGSPASIDSTAGKTVLLDSDVSRRVIASPVNNGAITVHFLPTHSSLLYGRDATLARLQFSADAQGAHLLKKITLTNGGTARNYDFTDLRLETRSGKQLTYLVGGMNERILTLNFNPSYVLPRGNTIVLLLKGKVHASWRRTIDFSLEEDSDLVTIPYQER